MKDFIWGEFGYMIDKTTDMSPPAYRLWKFDNGSILELDYFCEGESWDKAITFVEGYLTGKEKVILENDALEVLKDIVNHWKHNDPDSYASELARDALEVIREMEN